LIEAMVVVTIMGILAGLGIAGLSGAISNNRIKDAAINTTAFMERMASESSRMSSKICMKVGTNTLTAYKGDCSVVSNTSTSIASFTLEKNCSFVTSKGCNGQTNLGASFTLTPKLGLSAVPKGCLLMQYGSSDHMATSIKFADRNSMTYKLSYDGGTNWVE